jgi:hypothetical protein
VEDLTPSQKGAVAEAGITAMVIQLGLTVLRPLCEGRRYDLAVDLEPELHRGFLIPISEASGRRALRLRLDPTKNNQAQGIKWARDYELASGIERLRPRPQLILPEPGRLHFLS